MRMPVRRALLAATVTALALPSAASASCLPDCQDVVYDAAYEVAMTFECLPICLDELYELMDKALEEHEGDEAGTLCAYAKLSDEPPAGWPGDPGAPYIWVDTEEWGNDHRGEWDHRVCVPGCEDSRLPQVSEVPDLSSEQGLTIVKEAVACAAPLLP